MKQATERGTYIINVTLSDENGAPMAPKTATWSLYDRNGNIVHERSAQTLIVTAGSANIVLKGCDLVCGPVGRNEDITRTIVVEGTYDSTYGDDLPFAEEATFSIRPGSKRQ